MKSFFVLLIGMAGLFSLDVNAQSCCTPKTECKPVQCCPTQPSCCQDSESLFGNFFQKIKAELIPQKDAKSEPKLEQVRSNEKKSLAIIDKNN